MHNTIITIVLSALIAFVVSVGTWGFLSQSVEVPADTTATTERRLPLVLPRAAEEQDIIEVIDRVDDSVVSVIVTKDIPIMTRGFGGSLFDQFFFGDPRLSPFQDSPATEQETERREVGGGTAFFVSDNGLLLTNKHVVDDPDADYSVLLNDGSTLDATVVARHPSNDIAFLTVEGADVPALNLSKSEAQLGQQVIAIGNALGEFRNTVSVGVVSGLKRNITAGGGSDREELEQIIQTDAAINQGNSGGPLLNSAGEVIGMNTAIAAGAQNVGFALSSQDLQVALDSFNEFGKIRQAFLGVRYIQNTPELAEANDLPYDYGVIIVAGETRADLAIVPGSPADKAGLEPNDIILEFDGQRLNAQSSLAKMIRNKQPGETVTLTVFHDDSEKEVEVVLEESD
jgi:serine protease Do